MFVLCVKTPGKKISWRSWGDDLKRSPACPCRHCPAASELGGQSWDQLFAAYPRHPLLSWRPSPDGYARSQYQWWDHPSQAPRIDLWDPWRLSSISGHPMCYVMWSRAMPSVQAEEFSWVLGTFAKSSYLTHAQVNLMYKIPINQMHRPGLQVRESGWEWMGFFLWGKHR